ncbi:heat shock factor protein-like isoform X2 [Pomacea canaliculata]|uniref:heat shock factor protein-like isoform X2 n=1 Tax=Pomacea canaliculata TaxID=400727 RepID=UPI000D727217|nr:heat shock factor protein-like isoform X2 [Pomacea canaliculata]
MASKATKIRAVVSSSDTESYAVQENATGSGSNVPAFLMKLWTLVENPLTDHLISWDSSGKSFHIYEQSQFAHEILPLYFKHNNISSFIRQLNMYGFRKVVHVEQGGLKVEKDDLEFQHPYFQRGQELLLDLIKRKVTKNVPTKEVAGVNLNLDDVNKMLADVSQLRGKQDSLSTSFLNLKKQNDILWKELISLRQKHVQQQQIVNKLIQFLLSLVTRQGGMPGLKRKIPLMLKDSSHLEDEEGKGPSPKKKPHFYVDSPSDHDYTVQSPSAPSMPRTGSMNSASGPVIHELVDTDDCHQDHILQNSSPLKDSIRVTHQMSVPQPQAQTSAVKAASNRSQTSGLESLLDQALMSANISPLDASMVTPEQSDIPKAFVPDTLPGSSPSPEPPDQQLLQQPKIESQEQALLPSSIGQVILRPSDRPLSSTKDMSDQLEFLQADIDHLKEVLSSGQYNLDTSILLGLFDPQSPLPVNLDSPLSDIMGGVGSTEASISPQISGSITGQELWQYQPPEVLPDLFDFGTLTASEMNHEEEEDDDLPIFFNNEKRQEEGLPNFFDNKETTLNTPKPSSNVGFHLGENGDIDISVEDLD